MSRHRYVNLAFAGDQKLDREELNRLYRYEPIRPSDERFYHLDSLFELPEANLYAELTELSKEVEGIPTSSRQLFDDVRAAIDGVHRCGSLKSRVLAEPAAYLERSEELLLGLCRLGLRRRRFFLLTNSGWSYADGLCSHLFEGILPGLDHWRQLFDRWWWTRRSPASSRVATRLSFWMTREQEGDRRYTGVGRRLLGWSPRWPDAHDRCARRYRALRGRPHLR